VQQGVRIGRTTRNVNIHGDDGGDAADSSVVGAEDAAAAAACTDGHDEPWVGHRILGFFESEFHIAGHWAGHEQHIGVAGRGHEMDTESFKVVDRAGKADNFDFAAVAGTGVDFADVQGSPQQLGCTRFDLLSSSFEVRTGRTFADRGAGKHSVVSSIAV